MRTADVLDVIEALWRAAEHPDVVEVTRYGRDSEPGGNCPAGVKAVHLCGSYSMLWGALTPREARAVPLPDELPAPRLRPVRMLILTHRLLDVAKPDRFASWELCAAPGVGVVPGQTPSALRIASADGSAAYLRATAASGPNGDPETDAFADWQVPADAVRRPLERLVG